MKTPVCHPVVQPHLWERCYTWEDQPVLTVRLSLPGIQGPGKGCRRMERYYRHLEQQIGAWAACCHRQVCRLAQEALDACRPLPSLEIRADYQVTYQDAACLSLLWTLEAEGTREVFADLWALPSGTPLDGRALLSPAQRRAAGSRPLLRTQEGICVLREGKPVCIAPLPA